MFLKQMNILVAGYYDSTAALQIGTSWFRSLENKTCLLRRPLKLLKNVAVTEGLKRQCKAVFNSGLMHSWKSILQGWNPKLPVPCTPTEHFSLLLVILSMCKIGGELSKEVPGPGAFVAKRQNIQNPWRRNSEALERDRDKKPVTCLQITPLLLFYLLWPAGGLFYFAKKEKKN